MKNDFCKFKKGLLLSGAALILSTFSVQAMEAEREDDQGHIITTSQRGTLATLPNETLLHVLRFLPPEELSKVATLSTEMNAFSEEDTLWLPIASSLGIENDSTLNVSIKSQVKGYDILPRFETGKDIKLTGKHIQSLPQRGKHIRSSQQVGTDSTVYHFKSRNQEYQIAFHFTSVAGKGFNDSIEMFPDNAFAMFESLKVGCWMAGPALVRGQCPESQNLSDEAYKNNLDKSSPDYMECVIYIKEIQ